MSAASLGKVPFKKLAIIPATRNGVSSITTIAAQKQSELFEMCGGRTGRLTVHETAKGLVRAAVGEHVRDPFRVQERGHAQTTGGSKDDSLSSIE